MKTLLLSFIIMLSSMGSGKLDSICIGVYKGTLQSYEIMVNDRPLQVASSFVTIEVKEDIITYQSEGLTLEGEYTIEKNKNNQHFISADMSNGKSLHVKMYFKLDENGENLIVSDAAFEKENGPLSK